MTTARLAELMEQYKQTTYYALGKRHHEVEVAHNALNMLALATYDMPDVFSDEWCRISDKLHAAIEKTAGIQTGLRMAQAMNPDDYGFELWCYAECKRREWEQAKQKAPATPRCVA